MAREKRRYPRIEVQGVQLDVSDGMGCSSGEVRNVSHCGLCLAEIAQSLGKYAQAYTIVVSVDSSYSFKFKVRSRWQEVDGIHKCMGVELADQPSPQWAEYVNSLEL